MKLEYPLAVVVLCHSVTSFFVPGISTRTRLAQESKNQCEAKAGLHPLTEEIRDLHCNLSLSMAFRRDLMNDTVSCPDIGGFTDVTLHHGNSERCPSLNVLANIGTKIRKGGMLEDNKYVDTMEEASKLLDYLTVRARSSIDEEFGDASRKKEYIANDASQMNELLAMKGLLAARSLRELILHRSPGFCSCRKALLSTIAFMVDEESPANTLALVMVVSALALPTGRSGPVLNDDEHRASSRAAVSGLLYQKENLGSSTQNTELGLSDAHFGSTAVHSLITLLSDTSESNMIVDLHIVTSLARALVSDSEHLSSSCADCIRYTLNLDKNTNSVELGKSLPESDVLKGSFALAAELAPWSQLSPVTLVNLAMDQSLYNAAERICESTVNSNSNESYEAVHALIDGFSDRRMYRQSDVFATRFYKNGGMSRYVEARFMHACETIAQCVLKRQFPLVERQVERVDKAYKRVTMDGVGDEYNNGKVSEEVRIFALTKLREINEHDNAHRLAQLWKMDYWYNEIDADKFIKARREKYIQWKDVMVEQSADIPEVISNPDELVRCFDDLITTVEASLPVIGFDVEWGEDCEGAALLQLSSSKKAMLIDVPALLKSSEGCIALGKTAGNLFAGNISKSHPIIAVGFSCREDIVRLRSSVSIERSTPWFTSRSNLVDIKPIIATDEPKLKEYGLSRLCEHYIGKPLDKAEQCSFWDRRPLSESQRIYAALDAWAVVAICSKLPRNTIFQGNN